MAACLLALTIQLLEEALEIGHENVLAPQYFPLGEQLRKADVADHVIAVLAPILLGDAVEVEDFQYVGFRVSHINFQLHVGRVLRTVEVVLFLVFVPVVVLTGHDVAQGDEVELDIAEVVDIIRQGGKFLISSDGGKITGLEKVRKSQFLLTIEEFKELAKEAGCIDETESKLQ